MRIWHHVDGPFHRWRWYEYLWSPGAIEFYAAVVFVALLRVLK